eukprot:CAMPEP_0196579074 /NCGR_PEP_ID=MMETSP1081-20130531/17541_1 /TAXON_ID=36882 /ORGANISM="Pyramimonas amylifera, Strain CCMP720" /LENGTH=123 /DNA_ID=CAMNT_0041898523 /DNA_START=91 /DNA_END=462 /DNA_ORIENTATION=+
MALSLSQSACTFSGSFVLAARTQSIASSRATLISCESKPKAADFRSLSADDLDKEVSTCKRSLFDLRLKRATRQEYKSNEFKLLKKKVAAILTVKREKEIADGIGKRESRKLNKATSVRGYKF